MTDQFNDGRGRPRLGDKKPARAAGNESEYEVGYGKPPKNTRFKKGQSGNPKGRLKGRKNMSTIVSNVLDRNVTITENGQTRKVKFMEALVNQMAAKALNGSTRDQIALLKAIHVYAPELLKEAEMPQVITVQYVLPDGKTMEDYDNQDNDQRFSSVDERPESCDGEDDNWLN